MAEPRRGTRQWYRERFHYYRDVALSEGVVTPEEALLVDIFGPQKVCGLTEPERGSWDSEAFDRATGDDR